MKEMDPHSLLVLGISKRERERGAQAGHEKRHSLIIKDLTYYEYSISNPVPAVPRLVHIIRHYLVFDTLNTNANTKCQQPHEIK